MVADIETEILEAENDITIVMDMTIIGANEDTDSQVSVLWVCGLVLSVIQFPPSANWGKIVETFFITFTTDSTRSSVSCLVPQGNLPTCSMAICSYGDVEISMKHGHHLKGQGRNHLQHLIIRMTPLNDSNRLSCGWGFCSQYPNSINSFPVILVSMYYSSRKALSFTLKVGGKQKRSV
jgi:hypothetical protein